MIHKVKMSLFAFAAVVSLARSCTTDLNCSLNGICTSGACVCDKPWNGPSCGHLAYAVTPASAKDLYPVSDKRNTWNGPVTGPDPNGLYHLFVPIYAEGHLFGAREVMHATATNITGPYTWGQLPNISGAINPAYLVFDDAVTGKTRYSLWVGGKVHVADSAKGPYTEVPKFEYASVNPAPVCHNGNFYLTTQHTTQVLKTRATFEKAPDWTVFGNISHDSVASHTSIEDPYMWIDKRGNWHIINHAYDTTQNTSCGTSVVSAHFFSEDGKDWNLMTGVEPYSHTVTYDDGTTHTYATLERPNLHFDSEGQMTHLLLAADLVTEDEGCGPTPCVNCKYQDHAGTTIITLSF